MATNKDLELEINNLKNDLATNADITNRLMLSAYTRTSHGGDRDLYKQFGYPSDIDVKSCVAKYTRQDITKRIVDAYPKACWSSIPNVIDDPKSNNNSIFESEFIDLSEKLKLFHYLYRLDKLSGFGRYAVLVIGVKDGKNLSEPITNKLKPEDILYLSPYSEENATIQTWDLDQTSPRYGRPLTYNITIGGTSGSNGASVFPQTSFVVHYTRCIHIAEDLMENDVFGIPLLAPIFNRLMDLEKVVGGSSEIHWLNGRGGLHLDIPADAQIDKRSKDSLQESVDSYIHNLSRVLRTKGVTANVLEFEVADPTGQVDIIINLISATTGIPKRILIGSERGELSSSQDENNWLSRVYERQTTYCGPMVLKAIIDWMILYEVLPTPNNGKYIIEWEKSDATSESDKADVANKKALAIATYVNAHGADSIITPQQFVEDILHEEYKEDELSEMELNDQESKDDLNVEEIPQIR